MTPPPNRFRLPLLALLLLATSSAVADVPALGLGQLREFERAVQGVVERSMAATVCVRGVSGRSSGSGVIIDKQGLILTAAHVTAKAGRDLVIIFPDGRKVKGKALGADTSRDAGMARITEKGEYPFVPVGKSGGLKQNDFCVSMGHPGGFDVNRRPPVRLGRVLRVGRFITTDCTLIGGDSGGPLFDLEGRVVGIHANIGAPLSHNNHVPIDVFHENWERLRKGEKWGRVKAGGRGMDPNRPVLGVELDAKPGVEGAIIGAVTPGSPAEEAGLEAGDVIYRVDGTAVKNSQGIVAMIREKSAGDEITLAIRRGNAEAEVTIELVRARDLAAQRSTTGEDEDGERSSGEKPGKPLSALAELAKRAQENGGRLDLSPGELAKLQRGMAARMGRRSFTPAPTKTVRDAWASRLLEACKPAVAPAAPSVRPVVVDGRQVALATAVDRDGLLLTKASQIHGKSFLVGMGGDRQAAGELVATFEAYDLALIRVEGETLVPARWPAASADRRLGTFVAAVAASDEPAAIGVVSVEARDLRASEKGYLGVRVAAADGQLELTKVESKSPASGAGLKTGDVLIAIDGKPVATPAELAALVSGRKPGDRIRVHVRRGEDEAIMNVELGDHRMSARRRQRMARMNRMGGKLSDRRSGFAMVLQHDCTIEPQDCGGPLVDLEGRVLGLNIARAGRIKSYAIPATVVQSLLADVGVGRDEPAPGDGRGPVEGNGP